MSLCSSDYQGSEVFTRELQVISALGLLLGPTPFYPMSDVEVREEGRLYPRTCVGEVLSLTRTSFRPFPFAEFLGGEPPSSKLIKLNVR